MGERDRADQQVIAQFRAGRGFVDGALAGLSMLLLHHVGARSGAERVTPLAFWPVTDSSIAVLASNFGASRHPAWYHNLVSHPTALVEIGGETWSVKARVANPIERRQLLARIAEQSPTVARVVESTRREIPVVVLERTESPT